MFPSATSQGFQLRKVGRMENIQAREEADKIVKHV